MRTSEDRSFLILLAAISIAFAWVLWPFFGALLWAILLAIIFAPLYRRALETLPGKHNLAALFTVVVVIVMVLIPVAIVIASLIETCKLNGVEPHAWLTATLADIVLGHKQSQIDELLPWNYAVTV